MNQQILNINGQYIKFFVTTNATLPAILKNSGSAVVHHNVNTDYNSIWLGGELIAGGWGFVKQTHDVLERIAGVYDSDIKSIIAKEAHDYKYLIDRYDQIIYGVDHDKWNLNNYLQNSGEYADASNTYIITSLADLGGDSNIKIKMSQLPLLLRKAEYSDISFHDFKYTVSFKNGLTKYNDTIVSTSPDIELPVNSMITCIEVDFIADFNDSSGINQIIMNLLQYEEKVNVLENSGYYKTNVVQYDTSFSRIFDSATFTQIDTNEIVTNELGDNWSSIIYNIENETNTIYYSNYVLGSSNQVKYKVILYYADEVNLSAGKLTYKVLPGKHQLVELVGAVNATSKENLKEISKDEDGTILYDTINAIGYHNKSICNVNIIGYEVGYMFRTPNIPTVINEELAMATKTKLKDIMDFHLVPAKNDYICLVLPAWYKIKAINRINKDTLEEFNYTGFFVEIDKCYTEQSSLYVTNNPYNYNIENVANWYYGAYKSKIYIANITDKANNYCDFRVYTEINESEIEDLYVSTKYNDVQVTHNIISENISELFTIPDENFNETYWVNANSFKDENQFDWSNMNKFLSHISNADLT